MKQILRNALAHAYTSVPARSHVLGSPLALAACDAGHSSLREHAPAVGTGTKRCTARRTEGTWQNTAIACVNPVFAPYHQRPKDPVT